jgi:hypothetical protein
MGPQSQLPRLKNKTMDEIITRWATDLSKYQKEFKDQASKVAEWDRMLVQNGEKIQKLYTSTYEAERASNEIERQLAGVESQQDELSAWLDRYEGELNELFVKQIGTNEQIAGPDQERERTYKLAEKLTDRLDDMGKDLTKMIKDINDMSAGLSKGSKPDDPVCPLTFLSLIFKRTLICMCVVEPDCSGSEWTPCSAAVDRHQCLSVAVQGCCRSEGKRKHGRKHRFRRVGCCRQLLSVV